MFTVVGTIFISMKTNFLNLQNATSRGTRLFHEKPLHHSFYRKPASIVKKILGCLYLCIKIDNHHHMETKFIVSPQSDTFKATLTCFIQRQPLQQAACLSLLQYSVSHPFHVAMTHMAWLLSQ